MLKRIFGNRQYKKVKAFSPDELTKFISINLSRRKFLQGMLAGSMAIGIQSFNIVPAYADIPCTWCTGPCGNCYSSTGTCCSPNGQYCYSCSWSCPSCNCGGYKKAQQTACDNGAHTCRAYLC